jgi:hypothetical protein
MDLASLINRMRNEGTLDVIVGNPMAQFGPTARSYLGATVLPERLVPANEYWESQIRYRTLIANDGTRYSPVQIKQQGQLIGEFLVSLGHQDIGAQFSSRDYDALIDLLGRNLGIQAEATLIDWFDLTVNRALIERTEVQRWQAIIDAQVVRVGDNAYHEVVTYPNPPGHRVAVGGNWASDAYDPMDDIMGIAEFLADKGYTIGRFITSRRVGTMLLRNENIAKRAGRFVLTTQTEMFMNSTTMGDVNAVMAMNGFPSVELYDLTYFTATGIERFIPDDVFIILAATGQDTSVAFAEDMRYLPNIAGYTAIGRPAGVPAPGRVLRATVQTDKPPRVEAEGWQASLPVVTDPESIVVLSGI